MGAIATSSAKAANFTTPAYPLSVTGQQKGTNVFTVQGQQVKCSEAHFQGSLAAAGSVDLSPTYEGCTAFGFVNSKVEMNSCFFRLNLTGGTDPNFTGGVQVVCKTEGDSITVNAPGTSPFCTVHIPAQTPTTSTVDLTDSNANNVLVTSTMSGIHSNVTKNSFLCPLTTNATDTTGNYSGQVELEATGGKALDIG